MPRRKLARAAHGQVYRPRPVPIFTRPAPPPEDPPPPREELRRLFESVCQFPPGTLDAELQAEAEQKARVEAQTAGRSQMIIEAQRAAYQALVRKYVKTEG